MDTFHTGIDGRGQATSSEAMARSAVRQGEALAECARKAVRRFLLDMGRHPVDDLHRMVIGEVEKPLLAEVMTWAGGNQRRAAELLGINRATLRKKLIQYGLSGDGAD